MAKKKNKLPKYQTGGPIDPNLNNRLMQYLFGRNTNKSSILDVRSPNEYGVSLGDRFNIQSGLSFDPMSGMPSGYGKVGINNKGFNLGLEKRKGQSTFNVGYDSPNFNIDATYSNTNKMPSVGGNVGFNTKGFNVGVGGNYSPDNKNINANIGYNNNGFNAGLNYDYSGQSSLSGNVGYGNDLFNVGLSGNYAPGDSNINLNTTYNLGTRKKQKAEPIPLAFNTPEEIQMIKESANVDSNEAAGPPKKSYGGKITNMKKKKSNNLPKMFGGTSSLGNQNPNLGNMWGTKTLESATGPLAGVMKMLNGPLAPLAGMAMNSVTDMVHAINTPERERRPTLQNASSYTFDNGGTVKGKRKKKIKVNKKEYDINSPEYRKLYEQGLMAVDADGLPVNYQGSDEAWNEYYESKRKKKGEDAVRKGRGKFVKETGKLLPGNPYETDSVVENVLEYVPLLGQALSIDDAMLAAQDMYNGNKQGTFNNALDMIGVLPFGKAGNLFKTPKYIENAADAAGIYGVGNDVYQDNISPMLYPKTNNNLVPQNTNFATGEDEYGTGGTIKIKPSKKGTFTAAAKKHGKSVQAFASQVLANTDNYSPAMVKKANFARNAAKWKKAVGGVVRPEKGYTLMPNDEVQFANMPAAFDYANGGLTGTYMDAFDAMAYGGTIDPSMYMQQLMYGSYAQGGQVPQNIPVEVEGEEMYEMPNGQTGEFSGPKHENGGMPMSLPEGTKIYSDRLKVNGKTMAARKDKREANINKLERLLTKNPNDKFLKEALKRQQETNALQEQGDMQQQEMANQQQQMEEMAMEEMLMGAAQQDIQEGMMMAMGGMIKRADGSYSQRGLWDNIRANAGSGKKPTKEMLAQEKKIKRAEKAYGGMIKYADGTPPYGVSNPLPTYPLAMGVDPMSDMLQQTMMNGIPDPMAGKYPLKKENRFMNFLNNAVDKTGDFFSGLFDRNGNPKRGTTGNEYDLTEGDRTGMLGTSVGMYGPAMMTMLNKMQTPPNTNYFSTFGQDALRTQEEAEGLAGISKDEAYRKNLMRANALRKQLSNSARGVGDIRSGQLTAELAEQEGARGILTNYLQGMSQLKGQRAGLQQQIDQTRMGGEYQRDLADRQDVDQYYTNLAENVANASNMMQKQGRDLNVVQYNKDIMNLSKAYSKYGIYAVRDPKSELLTLAHKGADGKITYLSEEEAEELAKKQPEKQQPTVTTTTVEEPKKDKN